MSAPRTFSDAYSAARPLAAAGDRAAAARRLCGLLWHVDREHGGFIGLSDDELSEKCAADPRLDYFAATDAMHAPPPWPESNVIEHPVMRELQMAGAGGMR